MECLLCSMWARMPYSKRHTTPTTAQETEGALIIGYWIASRSDTVPRICERHMSVLGILDQQDEQRMASEQIVQVNTVQAQPVANSSTSGFQLGPGPLPNENNVTMQPPLPVAADPSAPYRTQINAIAPPLRRPIQQRPVTPIAIPGTMEGAKEAALAPPTEGAKVSYPCPTCGKEITTGDVHACGVVDEVLEISQGQEA